MTEKELLREFSLWVEIGGLVEENPNRTEQDWEDQIDSFLAEHHKQQEDDE